MSVDWLALAAGALTGFVVGLTGVGGGALMTPILLLVFGFTPRAAVGTDLWFAAATKLAITPLHHRRRLIDWEVLRRLWLGSLPAATVTIWAMNAAPDRYDFGLLQLLVAAAVGITAVSLLLENRLQLLGRRVFSEASGLDLRRWQAAATVLAGAGLGTVVTLTSIGAGAVGAVMLVYLYPTRLTPPRLVATDVAHAIPLALFAAMGHLFIGSVDGRLLTSLLAGSIPAAIAGARLSSRLSHRALRIVLALVLLAVVAKLLTTLR